MFSSKQTWQKESVSFSVPSLQTLQTLSSSKSMLTNCSSFIVSCGGTGHDKGRDRYFNHHPGEESVAPRLTAPHAARPTQSGRNEGGSVPGKFLPQREGAARPYSGTAGTEPSLRFTARAPFSFPSPEAELGCPVPSRLAPSQPLPQVPHRAYRRAVQSGLVRLRATTYPSAPHDYCLTASAVTTRARRQAPPAASGRDHGSCETGSMGM